MIFGMIFCLSFSYVRYERAVLKTVMRQKDRIDRAAAFAADVATDHLVKTVYERQAMDETYKVFQYAMAAAVEEEGHGLARLSVSLNGREVTETEIKNAKKGDELVLCFELLPETITAPGRRYTCEMILVRTVILD